VPSPDQSLAYAPFPLAVSAAQLGFVESSVSENGSTIVARHPAKRTSVRATIFLHGAAGSWTTWTPLLEAARASGVVIHNPVLVDLPGWGDATLAENASLDDICHLVKAVAEHLGYTEWDVIGHSMGGFIALHLGAIWPGNVHSIGVISPTAWSIIESVEHPVRRFGTLPAFTMLWRVMRLMRSGGIVRVARRLGLLRLAVFPLFRHPSRIQRSVIDALAREVRPVAFSSAAEITRGYDADARWASIECPVHALRGDRDVFVTPADFDRLRSVIPDATLTVIADCGHFAAVERPHETLEALGAF
jgi:pimeloyl-ACP methyl ester carboxylesterase